MTKLLSIVMALIAYISGFFSFLFPMTESYNLYSDVRYGYEERQVMDIYVPDIAYDRPENGCILFIHGGSWSNGDKREMASRCIEMTEKGYITATMNYTLYSEDNASDFTVDVMLDEIGMALRELKSFSEERELNVKKAALSGFSSGGHISLLYSYTRVKEAPLELVFTANMVAPADLSYEVWGELCPVIVSGLSGKNVTSYAARTGKADDIIASVSPVNHVSSECIPSLFAYGGKDPVVSVKNYNSIKSAFEKTEARYDFYLYPNSIHTLLNDPEVHEQYQAKLLEYCKTYFGH
ncbi:MAG: alpha/beta hydrolase [Clostridia bacterium]|nr:alpha/beta hydrolase [Clostridia bacterium]